MELPIITQQGKKTARKITLSPAIFGIKPNAHVIYLDVKRLRAALRQGTHQAKEKWAIRASTRKLRKQKGSGKARIGSAKSGVLSGGGRIFGPKPRNYDFKLNKKVIHLAQKSALSSKMQDQAIVVLEKVALEKPKTKAYLAILKALSCHNEKSLLILPSVNPVLLLASKNLPNAKVMTAAEINTYAILDAKRLLVSKEAIEIIEKKLT